MKAKLILQRGAGILAASRKTARHRDAGDEDKGAVIILALVYILVIGLTVGALSTWATNDLNNSTKFANASSLRYAMTSVTDAAIQSIRYNPLPAGTPTTNVATPIGNCWTPVASSLPNSATISEIQLDGYTIGVWCTTLEELSYSDTRDVTIYACQEQSATTGAACQANPFLTAEVAIDDYPKDGAPTFTAQCNVEYPSVPSQQVCGAGSTLENWVWGSSSGSNFGNQVSQTLAFYNSSYTTQMTTDTVIYGSGVYELYAQGSGHGALTYGSLSPTVCSVSLLGAVTILSAGSCTLTAQAAPTTGYTESSIMEFQLTVQQAGTSVTVTSSLNPSTTNQQVTYTAALTVTSPGGGNPAGSVDFYDGGSAIASCTPEALTGSSTDTAACSITYTVSGSHTISAQYMGSVDYAASTVSSLITQTVNGPYYSGGSNGQTFSRTSEYYYVNQNQNGSSSSTGDSFKPGVAETLTGLSVTLGGSSSFSTTTITVNLINGSTVTPTLTCLVSTRSSTCTGTGSFSVPVGDSINVVGVSNNSFQNESATWNITYTQP